MRIFVQCNQKLLQKHVCAIAEIQSGGDKERILSIGTNVILAVFEFSSKANLIAFRESTQQTHDEEGK